MTIRRITASGNPFSVGHALGQAAANEIRNKSFATMEYRELTARWKSSDYVARLEAAAREAFPRFVQEIEGIAAGAGLQFEDIFLWNCRGDLRLPEDAPLDMQQRASSGCTTIMIPARSDSSAEVEQAPAVIAHNEDGAPELLGNCFWVRVEPDNGTAFESFMYPGQLPGHTLGVNDRGLVQTINNIRVHDLKPGVPRHLICRAILNCADIDDALQILRRKDRASGFHHNLGQAGSQRLISVEAPASGIEIGEIDAPSAHANHLIAAQFSDTHQSITQSSTDRQRRADEILKTEGASTASDAEAILFEDETPIYRANDNGDDYSQTLSTGVFNIFRDRVDWQLHTAPQARDSCAGVVLISGD